MEKRRQARTAGQSPRPRRLATRDRQTTAGGETYDATTGRLLSRTDTAGTWSYTYDRAGNLVQAAQGGVTWVYGYDALNRLRSVWRNGVFVAHYAYDVRGRRIAKRARTKLGGGGIDYTRFVYRGANVAFETDSAGTIGLRYVWGPAADDLIAIRDAFGNHVYVVQDRLRSVRGLVRRDGTWLMSQRFGPYGAVMALAVDTTGIGFTLRYGWTGREFDVETGFYYHRSRYYDPGMRRFVQEDKIAYAGGANLYAYAEGRPLEGRDPAGHRANFEANPDWFNLDAFSGCFNFQCADIEYFFGLTGGGGGARIGSYADLLSCVGNAGCSAPPLALEFVLQRLMLAENLAWLDANTTLGVIAGNLGPRNGVSNASTDGPGAPPNPTGEFIAGVTRVFASHPSSVSVVMILGGRNTAIVEGRWFRTTPTIFGQRYSLFQGYWNGYFVHGEITVQTIFGISLFEGHVWPGWIPGVGYLDPMWLAGR